MDSKRITVQSSEQNEFIKTLQKMAYEYKRKTYKELENATLCNCFEM